MKFTLTINKDVIMFNLTLKPDNEANLIKALDKNKDDLYAWYMLAKYAYKNNQQKRFLGIYNYVYHYSIKILYNIESKNIYTNKEIDFLYTVIIDHLNFKFVITEDKQYKDIMHELSNYYINNFDINILELIHYIEYLINFHDYDEAINILKIAHYKNINCEYPQIYYLLSLYFYNKKEYDLAVRCWYLQLIKNKDLLKVTFELCFIDDLPKKLEYLFDIDNIINYFKINDNYNVLNNRYCRFTGNFRLINDCYRGLGYDKDVIQINRI